MKNLIISLGKRISDNRYLYYFLNFTWGLLTTTLGYLLLLILLPFGKVRNFNGTLYLEFKGYRPWGFSVGTVFFVGKQEHHNQFEFSTIIRHEYGHTVQNAMFGPLMIFLVILPSFIRYWYRRFLYSIKKHPKQTYDAVWFEGTATQIGINYYK
jgi:hypothetical protein